MTPIQELIETIEYNMRIEKDNQYLAFYNLGIKDCYKNILFQCKEDLLQKEKQAITDAFVQGNREVFYDGTEEALATLYFNNKYNTK